MGLMHLPERDSIPYETFAPEHRIAVRSDFGEEYTSLCVRILGHECLLTHEGEEEIVPRTFHKKYYVLGAPRFDLHA